MSSPSKPNTCMELVLYSSPLTAASSIEESIDEVTDEPLTTFTCFSRLPAELRVKIWKLTFPGARIVRILREATPQGYKFVSRARVPIALRVNAESRAEALKRYTISFAACNAPASIPFDVEEDILSLSTAFYFEVDGWGTCSLDQFPSKHIAKEDTDRVKLLLTPFSYGVMDIYLLRFTNLKCLRAETNMDAPHKPPVEYQNLLAETWDTLEDLLDEDLPVRDWHNTPAGMDFANTRGIDRTRIRSPEATEVVPWFWTGVFNSQQ